LPAGVPVVAGAGDSQCAAFGAGVVDPGPVSEMAGSSSCLNSAVTDPVEDPRVTRYSHVVPDRYTTELGVNTTGAAVEWAVRRLGFAGFAELAEEAQRFRRRHGAAATLTPSRWPRCSCPTWATGSATTRRSGPPFWACPTVTTARRSPGRCWKVWPRHCAPPSPRSERRGRSEGCGWRGAAAGGRLAILAQLKADTLGVPVTRLEADTAATGAALLAAVAVGLAPQAPAAISALVRKARIAAGCLVDRGRGHAGRLVRAGAARPGRARLEEPMSRYRLGINTCFAVKRWPEPKRWAEIVRDRLGLDLVQHSLDLVDLDAPRPLVERQAAAVRAACDQAGLELHSTFTGLAVYSSNLLLHPDPDLRAPAEGWYRQAIAFTATVGAGHRRPRGRLQRCRLARPAAPGRARGRAPRRSQTAGGRRPAGRARGAVRREPRRSPRTVDHGRAAAVAQRGRRRARPGPALPRRRTPVRPRHHGSRSGPHTWLERLGGRAPVVQLQQSDAAADHHWPFTRQRNASGRIEADQALAALDASGASGTALILEVIPPFEQDDDEVVQELEESVAYWRAALARRR
jgi:D-erythrulose 1-phosphate 3-epimerase